MTNFHYGIKYIRIISERGERLHASWKHSHAWKNAEFQRTRRIWIYQSKPKTDMCKWKCLSPRSFRRCLSSDRNSKLVRILERRGKFLERMRRNESCRSLEKKCCIQKIVGNLKSQLKYYCQLSIDPLSNCHLYSTF